MNKKTRLYIVDYILYRKGIGIFIILINLIFILITYIYHVAFDALKAAVALEVVLCLCFVLFDFIRFKKNKVWTMYINNNQMKVVKEKFPQAYNSLIEDYQQIIQRQSDNITLLLSENKSHRGQLEAHYSRWIHQIKTPISSLKLLIDQETFDNKVKMQRELFSIEQYAAMVLQVIRIESDTNDLFLERLSLNTVVKEAVKKHKIIFIEKKISVNVSQEDALILTDKKWLSFVLEQLISNALKYTKIGAITILIEKNQMVILKIRDTGIGILQEDLPRIFERGYTGYNGRQNEKSSGLGLYLCKRVLDMLGHHIKICSNIGEGTEVSLYFKVD